MSPTEYDVVIVGAGAGGCVAANRLSADPARRVLLLEAGPHHTAPGSAPAGLADSRYMPVKGFSDDPAPGHEWSFPAQVGDRTITIQQGRGVGGGTAINAGISLRGTPLDYDGWEKDGATGWSWADVEPLFESLENDLTGSHRTGTLGEWPIERANEAEYGDLHRAFVGAAREAGYPDCFDFNATGAWGVGPAPVARVGARRISAADTYLTPVLGRQNLEIRGDTVVDRVLFDGTAVRGVLTAGGETITAGHVVVAAGAMFTPLVLQRSGIGPRALLDELGVDVVSARPAGENLHDHPAVPLFAAPRAGAHRPGDFIVQTVVRTSSTEYPGSIDLQLLMYGFVSVPTGGGWSNSAGGGAAHVAGVGCVLNRAFSRGSVRIGSRDPDAGPIVTPNYLSHPADRSRAREMVRLGWDVVRRGPLAEVLGAPAGLSDEIVADDTALDAYVADAVISGYHFAGSARMGAAADEAAVVSPSGQVHGCTGLTVADASIMPTVPSANTMLPTVMVARRVAEELAATLGSSGDGHS